MSWVSSSLAQQAPALVVEPLAAYRSFALSTDGHGLATLTSPIKDTVWYPNERFHARCSKQPRGTCADAECACGVHGFHSMRRLLMSTYAGLPVQSRIAAWGQVKTYKRGVRATCAYPQEIFVSRAVRPHVRGQLERYAVPVRSGSVYQLVNTILGPSVMAGIGFAQLLLGRIISNAEFYYTIQHPVASALLLSLKCSIVPLGVLALTWFIFVAARIRWQVLHRRYQRTWVLPATLVMLAVTTVAMVHAFSIVG